MSLIDSASLIVTPNGYKEGKLYSVIPSDGSGDMSVTRATTATRVNSAGLVELVPYNLLTYSEQFDNAAWTTVNATITSNSITAPNGTMTGDTLTSTSTNTTAVFRIVLVTGTNTWSLYAKKGTGRYLEINTNSSSLIAAKFDLETGAIVGTPSVGANASIQNAGNGWYRCIITSATAIDRFSIFITNNTTTSNWDSSVGLSCYIWGAQLNEGTLKDYQKTETRLNIPRLDYSNGTCPSILVEPQRTNELLYSSSFSSAAWSIRNNIAIDLNSTISPSGITDAAKMRVTNNSVVDYGCFEIISSGTRVFSVFAKKAELEYLFLGFNNSFASEGVFFNLNNGTISQNTSGLTANVEDYGNGWYRCSVNLVNNNYHFISPSVNGTSFLFNNQQNNGIYIWGAQAEAGSYATSYIPTTSASVTRNADVISKTGISSLIGQTEGTLFQDIYIDDILNAGSYVNFQLLGTSGNIIAIAIYSDGRIQFAVLNGGVLQANIDLPSFGLTAGHHKFAAAYKNNDFVFYVDGVQVGSDTSGSVPATTKIDLADTANGKQRMNSVVLWKTRLTNDELERLTGTGFNTYTEMANYYNYITQ